MSHLETIQNLIRASQAYEQAGKISAALKRAQQALEAAQRLNHPSVEAEALVCLAKIRFRLGKYAMAASLSQEAREVAEPGSPTMVDAWQIVANCAAETDSLDEAEAGYLRAAELAREIGYSHGWVAALHGLAAGVYLPRGQFDLALAAELEACRMIQEEGENEKLVPPLVTMAMIYLARGEREKVAQMLEELGRLTLPGSVPEGYLFCLQAEQALGEGDWQAAKTLYQRARSNAEATGEPWLNINVRLGMSRCYRLKGEGPTAHQWAQEACKAAVKVGYRHEEGRARLEQGQAAWLCGQVQAARQDIQAAIAILQELGAAYDLAHARLMLAGLLHALNDPQADQAWHTAAEAVLAKGYGYLLQRERRRAYPLLAQYLNHPKQELAALSERLLVELEKTPATPLQVCVLGYFAIYRGSEQVSPTLLKQRQAGELFRLLLISPGRRLSREQVIEALWGDKPLATAINAFHQATSALRHALEPDLPGKFPSRYLTVEEGLVSLHLPPGSQVDYEQFEEHIRRGEWQQAVALWQGEPFSQDCYKDWAAWKREQLTFTYLRALLTLAESHLAAGEAQEALEACQNFLRSDPWHERAALLAMQACLKMDNRAGALRIYLNLERCLQDELGVAPQDELRQFYLSLLE